MRTSSRPAAPWNVRNVNPCEHRKYHIFEENDEKCDLTYRCDDCIDFICKKCLKFTGDWYYVVEYYAICKESKHETEPEAEVNLREKIDSSFLVSYLSCIYFMVSSQLTIKI